MKRDNSIDFTRAVAVIIIVTCHFLSFGGGGRSATFLGQYLGEVGNLIFFAVSALLFGMLYEKKGNAAFACKPFLKKRLKRLFASLWPFLIVIIPLYLIRGVYLSPVKVTMNFVGLAWFGKLPDNGHLWFVTAIIFCYLMYVAYCRCRIKISWYGWLILLLIAIVLQLILDRIHLPGYVFIILLYSLWIFTHSTKLLMWISNIKWWSLILLTIGLNSIAVVAYMYSDMFGVTMVHWTGYLAGFSLFMTLMKVGKYITPNKMIMFLSLTGYEIYLVHHCMCCGTFSVIHTTEYVILNYSILWICSAVFGWILKQIGDKVSAFVTNKS